MTTAVYAIFTAQQRLDAIALNGPEHQIDPRFVDAANPPGGVNVNESGGDIGDPISTVGKYATTASLVNDPAYIANCPDMVAFVNTMPWIVVDGDMLFAPPPPEG